MKFVKYITSPKFVEENNAVFEQNGSESLRLVWAGAFSITDILSKMQTEHYLTFFIFSNQ